MHTIRLRGPWQVEPIERYARGPDGLYAPSIERLPAGTRAKMPADWAESLGADYFGRVRYRRNFQKPTGLDRGERVWLVVEPPRSRGDISLNSEPLGEVDHDDPPARFDITSRLQGQNHLEVIVQHPALDAAAVAGDDSKARLPGGLIGEVRLEIED